MQSKDGCGFVRSTWMAAHVFKSGETSYNFSHFNNGVATCEGNFSGELVAFIVAYRGATQNATQLTVYGSASSSNGDSFTTQAFSPPGGTTLLTIFSAPGEETNGSPDEAPVTFSAPSGTPALTAESPLAGDLFFKLAADVTVPTGGVSYGGYTTTQTIPDNCVGNIPSCLWYAFEVAVPE